MYGLFKYHIKFNYLIETLVYYLRLWLILFSLKLWVYGCPILNN